MQGPGHHHHRVVVVVEVHRMAAVGRRSLLPLRGLCTDQQVELVQELGLELLSPLRNLGMVWLICYVQNLCGGLPTVNNGVEEWTKDEMNEKYVFFSFGGIKAVTFDMYYIWNCHLIISPTDRNNNHVHNFKPMIFDVCRKGQSLISLAQTLISVV